MILESPQFEHDKILNMKFYSTKNKAHFTNFAEALRQGLAPDGGLYCPESIPSFSAEELNELLGGNRYELATEIIWRYTSDVWSKEQLYAIIKNSLNFEIPLKKISENIAILELFHGPTEAFKDVGARFMARSMSHFLNDDRLTILVATSGDTGSAVADGFWKVDGIDVVILFPKNGVSTYQENQMTTLGENISAVEVEGTFDDCQDLVKKAFQDKVLNQKIKLSSANSINIGRLLPQSLYYYFIAQQHYGNHRDLIISVPSGNFGNLTSGLYAHRSGLSFKKFIAATNANNTFPHYQKTGTYEPKRSVPTLSNAMDVGKPSNFERIMDLYDHNQLSVIQEIMSTEISDDLTIAKMRAVYSEYGYLLDPHAAVGWSAINHFQEGSQAYIVLGTAHPRKFESVVHLAVPEYTFEFPVFNRMSKKLTIKNDYSELMSILVD